MMPARAPGPLPPQRQPVSPHDLLPLGDWIRHHSLRSLPVLLFLALICVPSIALVVLGTNPSAATFDHVAWIFAAYFAIAWLLLLGVIIRPAHVTRLMLLAVVVIALATQVPLAVALETALHGSTSSLGPSIVSVGVPEEVAKALPVLVVALIYRGGHQLTPRDYLFLGAVSGLAFGAAEVVHFFTVNESADFYATVRSAVPSINRLLQSGHSPSASLFAVLVAPVRAFILEFVWRFVTDPISHACWSGLTGYFIGLAATRRHHWISVSWMGLAAAAILHGLNDWSRVNGHPVWIVVTVISGILFLGYAKVGARAEPEPAAAGVPQPYGAPQARPYAPGDGWRYGPEEAQRYRPEEARRYRPEEARPYGPREAQPSVRGAGDRAAGDGAGRGSTVPERAGRVPTWVIQLPPERRGQPLPPRPGPSPVPPSALEPVPGGRKPWWEEE